MKFFLVCITFFILVAFAWFISHSNFIGSFNTTKLHIKPPWIDESNKGFLSKSDDFVQQISNLSSQVEGELKKVRMVNSVSDESKSQNRQERPKIIPDADKREMESMDVCVTSENLAVEQLQEDDFDCILAIPQPQPYAGAGIWYVPSFRERVGNGLGYRRGYESAELMLGLCNPCWQYYPFLDLQLHHVRGGPLHSTKRLSNHAQIAGNIGIGFRELIPDCCFLLGGNIFYDFRSFANENLQSLGLGFEFLNDFIDVRSNAYIPIGRRVHQQTKFFAFPGGFFTVENDFQESLWRFDIECGGYLCQGKCGCIYVAAGPYFFGSPSQCCGNNLGGMGRITASICRYLEASFYVTTDPVFKTRVQAEISLSVPFSSCCNPCSIYNRIRRNEILMTKRTCTFTSNF